ncbi:MAG: hypothetical protein M3296_06340, partial [Actinomycetota bacterium]|nr:hypothetical protein [Actinomycetota bacterium]
PRVCVWPEHAKWAPLAARLAHRARVALTGVGRLPSTLYERGIGRAGAAKGDTFAIDAIPVTAPALVTELVAGIVPSRPPRCTTDLGDRLGIYVTIAAWIRMRAAGTEGDGVYPDEEQLQALLRRSPGGQARWVRRHLAAASRCDVPVSRRALDELS